MTAQVEMQPDVYKVGNWMYSFNVIPNPVFHGLVVLCVACRSAAQVLRSPGSHKCSPISSAIFVAFASKKG